jgi:hypothetical protein
MAPEETRPPGPSGEKPPADKPRIHVDSDWKRQAQAEKERLAREVERQAAAPPPRAAAGPRAPAPDADMGEEGSAHEIPPATFTTLIQTLATQAAIFMSGERDPETGESLRQLGLAKHNIDLLAMLEEKTKGNLTDEEKGLLDTLLYELRMAYISAAS